MVLSSYDDEIHILGSVHHVLKIGSHLSSQTKKLQWLTIRTSVRLSPLKSTLPGLEPVRAELERTNFRPERADFRPEKADSRPERADFGSERVDFRLERADFRPERA